MARWVPLLLCLAYILTGCCSRERYLTFERLDRGLLVVLPGIEGPGPLNQAISDGLALGGVDWAVEIYDWHPYEPGVWYAFDEGRARRRGREIAAHIAEYKMLHPGRPAVIVGHSGGGAIAVFAAEAMQDGGLYGVITLGPSLSPRYDLTSALSGTRYGIVNYHSNNDFLLGTLVAIGRNVDGTHGRTAGQIGFSPPKELGASGLRIYADRLRQVGWNAEMVDQGHWGGHFGWANSTWVAESLAPVIQAWEAKGTAGVAQAPGALARRIPPS
jgi:hypothetical protein